MLLVTQPQGPTSVLSSVACHLWCRTETSSHPSTQTHAQPSPDDDCHVCQCVAVLRVGGVYVYAVVGGGSESTPGSEQEAATASSSLALLAWAPVYATCTSLAVFRPEVGGGSLLVSCLGVGEEASTSALQLTSLTSPITPLP